jgi:hypothetical protein
MAEPKSFPALNKLLNVYEHEDRPLSYREDYFSLIVQARAELEKARELLRKATVLHEACRIADAAEELSEIVDGSFLDDAKEAIAACQPVKQLEK